MEEEIGIDPEIKDLDEPSPDEKLNTGPKIITKFEILPVLEVIGWHHTSFILFDIWRYRGS